MMPVSNVRNKANGMYLLSQGSGDAVLFLHGIPTSCHLWDGVIERMSGAYTCMAVDLPGLGRTPKTREGFGELNAIVAQLEALRIESKVERWHVVGHDAGCAIAVHYAHQHPVHTGRLALLTPSIFPELEPFFLFELLRKPVLGELMAPLVNLIFWKLVMRKTLDGSQAGRDVLSDFRAPFSGPLGAWRLMSLLRWGRPEEVLAAIPALLPELLMPTLIFHGANDPAVPASFAMRASGLIPDSEMVMTDSGHFLPMNEPAAIADRLLSFLDKSSEPKMAKKSVDPQWEVAPIPMV